MKGYKGMRHDMTCRGGMKYEIGKTYHVDGNISVCRNGLHFCETLRDVLYYYSINDGSRYFEVEADGVIKKDRRKCVTSSLTVIREIKGIELYRVIYDPVYDNIHGNDYGDGIDYGYGDTNGNGYGNSIEYNHGNGDGYGDGYGYNYGYGNGDGSGRGYGDIYGDGYGNEYGFEYGHINDIVKYV